MRNDLSRLAATVQALRDLSPTVREFEIRPSERAKPWSVGSHLNVQVKIGDREETRSYSLVGMPQESQAANTYRIAVKRAEASHGGSRFMHSLQLGDALTIGEPNNHFDLNWQASDYLLIAGGIGITPLLGMAQALAARGANLHMHYAARDTSELVYGDLLRQLLGERLQLHARGVGPRLDVDAAIAALPQHGQALVCGPLPLLEAVQTAWARSGRRGTDLRFETFGNSGRCDAQPFWVELPRHQLRLEVPADRSLLDVLNEAGVETLYDCCRGECGLCAMDIVSVQGNIDHRDVFFSAHEKQSNQRLCACVSRVSGGGVVLDSAYRPD